MELSAELLELNNFIESGVSEKQFSLNYENRTPKALLRLGNAEGPNIERSLKRYDDFRITTEEGVKQIDSLRSNGMVYFLCLQYGY